MVGSFIEKAVGSAFALAHWYQTPWFMALWLILVVALGMLVFKKKNTYKWPMKGLYVSVVFIVVGLVVSTFSAQSGKMCLKKNSPQQTFSLQDDKTENGLLPFVVDLQRFEIQYYPNTKTPQGFVGELKFSNPDGTISMSDIAMNHVAKHDHYRFYLSSYDSRGTVQLLVSYDPWGIALTYMGYVLFLIFSISFFVDKNGRFRMMLKNPLLTKMTLTILFSFVLMMPLTAKNMATPPTISRESAEKIGKLQVLYNDRICPLQTLAKDFTIQMYGAPRYKGLSSEQVLCGWMFFFEEWYHDPFLKIDKSDAVAEAKRYAEFQALLKVFPIQDTLGNVTWCAPTDSMPKKISKGESVFIHQSMLYARNLILQHEEDEFLNLIGKIDIYQKKNATRTYSSALKSNVERQYNRWNVGKPVAIVCLCIGVLFFGYVLVCMTFGRETHRFVQKIGIIWLVILSLYLLVIFMMRWYVAGYIPLSNGTETMFFLALCMAVMSLWIGKRHSLMLPIGCLLTGFALLVAMLGGYTLSMSQLMPVLSSPILSVHVTIIMLAYALLAFVLMNGLAALGMALCWCIRQKKGNMLMLQRLQVLSQLMLYPAVFLLALGIFVGAVWANVSWGNYWSWDPKEVWALITLMVYALLLSEDLYPKIHRNPICYHLYAVLAFVCVLTTYFGVNLFLGGLHGQY